MEKMISIYWFVILILVAVGIASMVFTFYSHPYDVREAEATILMGNVANCVVEQGVIVKGVLDSGTFNPNFSKTFLEKCHLTFNMGDEKDSGEYFIKVNFSDFDGKDVFGFIVGNPVLETHCDPQKEKELQRLSKCVNGSFYAVDQNQNQYIVNILSVIRKTNKNAK
jgi:hypothetical protein